VILFNRKVEEFKHKARELRFFVRDFTIQDLEQQTQSGDEAKKLTTTLAEHQNALLRWCRVNFAEAFSGWIHLKAIRVFVEAVLRYGLPTNFQAILIHPAKKEDTKLRKVLMVEYARLGKKFEKSDKDEDEQTSALDKDFYPYVYTPVETDYLHGARQGV